MAESSSSIVQQRCGPVDRCLINATKQRVLVNICHTGDYRGGMSANARDAGQGNPYGFGAVQIGGTNPYKIFYVFFLSHPIPSMCEIFS